MDYELHNKLKKGNLSALHSVGDASIKRLWFICYNITQDVTTAAPLLIESFDKALNYLCSLDNAPNENFLNIAAAEIFKNAKENASPDDDFDALTPPTLAKNYTVYTNSIKKMSFNERAVYLTSTFGNLDAQTLSKLSGTSYDDEKKLITELSSKLQDTEEIKKLDFSVSARLYAAFKSPDGSTFRNIEISPIIINTIEHNYQIMIKKNGGTNIKPQKRKETDKMGASSKNTNDKANKKPNKNGFKYTKPIAITAVILAVIIAALVILPKVIGNGKESTRIVTYNVEKITKGNVTQTISGSGTLSPVSKKTLTSSKGGDVTKVNFSVGDAVEEDDVIAVINGESIKAPFDGILIELPIAVDDEVAVGGSVAMVMGKDGFTMGIAVDETEISSVKLDQEVTFTVDALNKDYTGKVTAISYNGSSSGGSVAFQITATVDYIEGVFPGMSASAKIVIEDSGEGLLVPVDAVETSGDEKYIYLAPSDAEDGTSYGEEDIDASALTKVTVETGMSDGSYMIVESDDLSEGDLIIVEKVTSTATGSDDDGESSKFGGMGGFPGGKDSSDFDFQNFDPSQMPQGGNRPQGNSQN